MTKSTTLLLTFGLGTLLSACQPAQSEKDMIAEAQFCLDDARDAASADSCLSKISGLQSTEAYTLRCAGGFIAAQVTNPEKLSKALNAISEGQGATALLSTLSFPTTQLADDTFASCNKSGRTGMKLMSALAKSATALASAAQTLGSCADLSSCDPTQMESTINDLITKIAANDGAAEATVISIVSSVQTVYSSTCAGTATANSDVCNQINEAVAQSNFPINTTDQDQILAIGKELLLKWKEK